MYIYIWRGMLSVRNFSLRSDIAANSRDHPMVTSDLSCC